MAKPELGIKRHCLTCQAAFFDLNRDPILCVKCGAVFHPVEFARSPPRRLWTRPPTNETAAPVQTAEPEAASALDDDDNAGEEATIPPPDDDDDDLNDIGTIKPTLEEPHA